jgi:hypothetical protein
MLDSSVLPWVSEAGERTQQAAGTATSILDCSHCESMRDSGSSSDDGSRQAEALSESSRQHSWFLRWASPRAEHAAEWPVHIRSRLAAE